MRPDALALIDIVYVPSRTGYSNLERVTVYLATKKAGGFRPRLRNRRILRQLFADRLALGKKIQVIRAARFGVGSRHIESAERMRAHDRSRALAIDVQVADVELLHGTLNLRA